MTVRRIDPDTGDIVTRGRQFIEGDNTQEEIGQVIRTRLRLFTGEYFRDITDGTPWFETILDKNSTLAARDAAIKQRIAQTEGVIRLITFETDYDVNSRGFTLSCEVLTAVGIESLQLSEGI